ncbi:hypothetical protein H4Q26_012347 [Puccinia striiformis f. sp. tritici PST-130]|nr:hypothetical protein H4Q26_012347 [Puccinia striiformis f. sp. tritici PST-130]
MQTKIFDPAPPGARTAILATDSAGASIKLAKQRMFSILDSLNTAIQRQNVAHTILILKAMGINDLSNFDFMDPPPSQTMITAWLIVSMRSRYEKTDNCKAKRIVRGILIIEAVN